MNIAAKPPDEPSEVTVRRQRSEWPDRQAPLQFRGARKASYEDIELTRQHVEALCAQFIQDARLWLAPLAENLPLGRCADVRSALAGIADEFSNLSGRLKDAADEAAGR